MDMITMYEKNKDAMREANALRAQQQIDQIIDELNQDWDFTSEFTQRWIADAHQIICGDYE